MACRQEMGSLLLCQQHLSLYLQHVPQGNVASTWSRVAFAEHLEAENPWTVGFLRPLLILRLWSTFGLLRSSGSIHRFPACSFHPFWKMHTYWF